jgi:hypothetical protein
VIPRARPSTVDEVIADVEHVLVYHRGMWRGFWMGVGVATVTVVGLHVAGVL